MMRTLALPRGASIDWPARAVRANVMSQPDAELVRQVAAGDSAAFETLVRRHLAAAHAAAFDILQDGDDAEDVCQDAFITALRRIKQLNEPDRFRPWLITIVRNRALDVKTSARVRMQDASVDSVTLPAADRTSDRIERAELRSDLAQALDSLTRLQRDVLLRHDYEGMRHGEIARELGISAGASRFHLHVARKAMRALLRNRHNGELAT
jgi:RNA polymerase sigma-70 factor (ECF subfamily)